VFAINASAQFEHFAELTIGQPLTNQTLVPGDVVWYRLAVQPGQHLYVFLDKDTSYTTYLTADEGELPARGNSSSSDQLLEVQTTRAGLLYIRVETGSRNNHTFTITVREQLSFPELTIGQPLTNQTLVPGDVVRYQLAVQPGQQLYVFLDKETEYTTYLTADEGQLPARGNSSSSDQLLEVQTTRAGLLYIRVETGSRNNHTFTITVRSTNSPPSFLVLAERSINDGEALTFLVAATDTDEDTLAYQETALPSGAVFDPATRRFTWTPTATQVGSHAATFRVADGQGGSDTLTVSITVTDGNHPPAFATVSAKSGNEGERLSFTVSATDTDGDALTYTATSRPSGAVFDASTRRFTWTPDFTQAGAHTVTFRVSDRKAKDTLTVSIIVRNVNRSPVFVATDAQTVSEGEVLAFTVSGADPDADDVLTYAAGSLPEGATFTASTRELRWTPDFDQQGDHAIEFGVDDGSGGDDTLIVPIVVENSNRLPTFVDLGDHAIAESSV
jgi:hypothetical protein